MDRRGNTIAICLAIATAGFTLGVAVFLITHVSPLLNGLMIGGFSVAAVFLVIAALINWWPEKVSTKPELLPKDEFIPAYEMLDLVVNSSQWAIDQKRYWMEKGSKEKDMQEHLKHLLAQERFSEVARNGGIQVKGRKGGLGMHESIPSDYWFSAGIDPASMFEVRQSKTIAITIVPKNIPLYTDLLFSKLDIEKEWPLPSIENER